MPTNIEVLTRRFFSHVFYDKPCFYNHRPDWLRMDRRNLELDLFFPTIPLAIEVNGPVHEWSEEVAKKDAYKEKMCKYRQITLLKVADPKMLLSLATFNYIRRMLRMPHKDLFKRFSLVPDQLRQEIIAYKPMKIKHLKGLVEWQDRTAEYRRVQAREDQLNALRYRNKARA